MSKGNQPNNNLDTSNPPNSDINVPSEVIPRYIVINFDEDIDNCVTTFSDIGDAKSFLKNELETHGNLTDYFVYKLNENGEFIQTPFSVSSVVKIGE